MIARFPVWKGKPKTMETWWGLVGALIMVDELLDDSIKLTDMFKGYYYDLRFWDPNTRRMRWIRNNTDFDLATLTVVCCTRSTQHLKRLSPAAAAGHRKFVVSFSVIRTCYFVFR